MLNTNALELGLMTLETDSNVKKIGAFGRSLKNQNWVMLDPDTRLVSHIAQSLGIEEMTARILVNRGVGSAEEALNFLNPKLKNLLPDPFLLMDMDKAAMRAVSAIKKQEKIMIFADYDVDGATSSSLIHNFFHKLGINVEIYVADRVIDGYGPSKNSMSMIRDKGTNLLITVDCGIGAFEALDFAANLGLDVVVLDHHLSPLPMLPKAAAVVNPNRYDENFEHKSIAAVAVAFLFTVAVRKLLRDEGWFDREGGRPEPDMFELLDLVALGTICDVVPLTLLNRIFVIHGLKQIMGGKNIGISTLMERAGIEGHITSYHLGYVLGPRINAGGRIGKSHLGADLLTAKDVLDAKKIADMLEMLNNERKAIEQQALEEAISQIEQNTKHFDPVVIVYSKNWHIGILGIVASRLKEKYRKPTIVMAIQEDGICKGSARSIEGFNMGKLLSHAKSTQLVIDGGGHSMAGGFTLAEKSIDEFVHYVLRSFCDNQMADVILDKANELVIDSMIKVQAVGNKLLEFVEKIGPFGHGNSQPRFVLTNVRIAKSIFTNKGHVLLFVEDAMKNHFNNTVYGQEGIKNEYEHHSENIEKHKVNQKVKCVFFKGADTEIGSYISKNPRVILNIAGTIQPSNIDHGKVDFIVDDISVLD